MTSEYGSRKSEVAQRESYLRHITNSWLSFVGYLCLETDPSADLSLASNPKDWLGGNRIRKPEVYSVERRSTVAGTRDTGNWISLHVKSERDRMVLQKVLLSAARREAQTFG
jgi:hypothetical protein